MRGIYMDLILYTLFGVTDRSVAYLRFLPRAANTFTESQPSNGAPSSVSTVTQASVSPAAIPVSGVQ